MELTEYQAFSKDLAALKAAQGLTAKKALAATWTKPYHSEFLDMIGNDKRH